MRAGSRSAEGSQSIARAFALLRLVATGGDAGLGLSDIATLAALPRPTCHRILSALVAEGLVEQRPRTRRYGLGVELQFLALSRTARAPLVKLAEPRLQDAANDLGDTLFLTLRSGLDTICVARRLGSYPVQVLVLNVGDRRPLGVSSAGIALLATLPEAEADAVLAENDVRLRSRGTSREAASSAVQAARLRGYALRSPGLVPGTRAVSVAIVSPEGEALGALTLAAISRRLGAARLEAVVGDLHRWCASYQSALARAG